MTTQLNKQLGTESVIWNLNDLYDEIKDCEELDKDISHCLTEAKRLNSKFSDKVGQLTAKDLHLLVSNLESLASIKGKISTFAFLNFTTQTKNSAAAAFLQKVKEIFSEIGKETVFFELEWTQIEKDTAQQLLDSPELAEYQHYLESLRRYAPYLLSKIEESLLIEIAPVGRGSWTLLFDKIMGHLKFGEDERTEEEVLSDLYNPERKVREQATSDLTTGLNSQLHVLTHLTNTLLADKMIDDGLRTYPTWVSSMNLYNELPDSTVDILVDTVISRYDIPQRYYEIKKSALGYDELFDYDRYAPLPNLPSRLVPWDECKDLVIRSFNEFSPIIGDIGKLFFTENWIHAPILEGKRGGAFAHPCTPEIHPYIMVNYTGNIRDISTVAHELGHGIHQYLAAKQGYYNSDTPLVLAETASVFAELLLFNFQLNLLDDPLEKTAFISQKLESIFATVFRQIAMNRFENLSHNGRRNQGELSSEQLSDFWLKTQDEMFGDSVTLTENYSVWWSYIPHFLNSPGYVYSYAFGELLVLSLYQLYLKEGGAFVTKYIDLLSSGGKKSPRELLEPFDIDLNDRNFWQGGLDLIDSMLNKIATK